jgi:hypothetical protein
MDLAKDRMGQTDLSISDCPISFNVAQQANGQLTLSD